MKKNVLVGGSWRIGKDLSIIQNKQSTSQPSFLKTDGIDSHISFNHSDDSKEEEIEEYEE